jgi:hypothetical protein
LEQVARGGLQPRIANIAFHAVSIQAGGNVLIIRVPRSYSAPHRIIRQNRNRFYARSAAGKYEPDVNELRALFIAGPQLADRVRNFRLDRIARIAAGNAPVQLMYRSALVLHVVPLSAFDVNSALPLAEIAQDFRSFVPTGSSTANGTRINFEGVLKTSNADPRATQHRAYVQLYRSGIVEAADSSVAAVSTPRISLLDDKLIAGTMRYLKDLIAFGIEPPYAVLVSLIGVGGARLDFAPQSQWGGDLSDPLERDQYHLDEVIIETIPADKAECAGIIRPILDQAANIGGRATSPLFDNEAPCVHR